MSDITGRTFRRNPLYTCVPLRRLPRTEHITLEEQVGNSGVVGVLRPKVSELSTRVVGKEIALLYRTLVRPSKLSASLVDALTKFTSGQVVLAALVLDRILEVESDRGFVSGVESHSLLFDRKAANEPGDTIGRLSVEALKYGQALMLDDSLILSSRLYCFNRMPASPNWKQQLPSRDAVAEYLGICPGGSNHEMLDRHWKRVLGDHERPEWLLWHSKGSRSVSATGQRYKLYVSPKPAYLREAFQVMLQVIGPLEASAFKVGADLYGVLRPDKFVAYFPDQKRMFEAARQIGSRLTSMPAQGVPFTASLDANGAVSWGVDPPNHVLQFPWNGRSWRSWLTERLAVALITASPRRASCISPWEFALDRVSLDGIDTATWKPDSGLWDNGRVEGEDHPT